jgi:hypothetical protein
MPISKRPALITRRLRRIALHANQNGLRASHFGLRVSLNTLPAMICDLRLGQKILRGWQKALRQFFSGSLAFKISLHANLICIARKAFYLAIMAFCLAGKLKWLARKPF